MPSRGLGAVAAYLAELGRLLLRGARGSGHDSGRETPVVESVATERAECGALEGGRGELSSRILSPF